MYAQENEERHCGDQLIGCCLPSTVVSLEENFTPRKHIKTTIFTRDGNTPELGIFVINKLYDISRKLLDSQSLFEILF